MSESIRRVVYISKASPDFSEANVEEIVNLSALNNAAKNITGGLAYTNGYFYQCLEGSSEDVCALMDIISGDERHTDVKIISDDTVDARVFSAWSMANASQVFGDDFESKIVSIAEKVYG